jgi:hypothetical protein
MKPNKQKLLKAIAAGVLCLSLTCGVLALTTAPGPPVDTSVLQSAVNAYAAIGVPASCGTYVTSNIGTAQNPGGMLVNNVCNVGGQWVDADLTVRMSGDQLATVLRTNGGSQLAPVGFNEGDPSTVQVSSTVSVPTVTAPASQSTAFATPGGNSAAATVGAAVRGAGAGCAGYGAINAILLGGGATEITQLCNYAQLAAQLAQLAKTYSMIAGQYDYMLFQAKYIKSMSRYASVTTPWQGIQTTNTYGTTAPWLNAANTGLNALGAWRSATVRPVPYRDGFLTLPSGQLARKQTDYSTLELQDGAGVGALDTIGRIRVNGPQVEGSIQALENDSLADDANLQTLAAQLNKANALGVIHAKLAADQNKLLVSNSEMNLLRLKKERDAEAYALQNDVIFRSEGKAALDAQHAGASAAIAAFRMP